jgi:hypothetical protein
MNKATAATTFLATMLASLIVQAKDRLTWRVNEPIPTAWESSADTATHSPSDRSLILTSFRGFELAHLQAGLDLSATTAVGVGPFVGCSIGQFSRAATSNALGSTSGDLANRVMHQWFEFGVRGVLAL